MPVQRGPKFVLTFLYTTLFEEHSLIVKILTSNCFIYVEPAQGLMTSQAKIPARAFFIKVENVENIFVHEQKYEKIIYVRLVCYLHMWRIIESLSIFQYLVTTPNYIQIINCAICII